MISTSVIVVIFNKGPGNVRESAYILSCQKVVDPAPSIPRFMAFLSCLGLIAQHIIGSFGVSILSCHLICEIAYVIHDAIYRGDI